MRSVHVRLLSQFVSSLIYCPLVRPRIFATLQPQINVWPALPLRPQLHRINESHRNVHHRVRSRDVISAQEGTRAFQLLLKPIEIILHVFGHSFFDGGQVAVGHAVLWDVPASILDRETVEEECAFCGVEPLEDFDALCWVFGYQSVFLVVGFAEVSDIPQISRLP